MSDHYRIRAPLARSRRLAFFLLAGVIAAAGVGLMWEILATGGVAGLEWAVLPLFAITFSWIALAFVTAVAGFCLRVLRIEPLSLRRRTRPRPADAPLRSRTALVMPICNEDCDRVLAGIEAHARELVRHGIEDAFDLFVLSDTGDARTAEAEAQGVAAVARRLGGRAALYYRRRTGNEGRKAGNIAEFCRRWGSAYEYMIVIDADSVMAAPALCEMVRTMDANPGTGIIQTVPLPVRQRTPFGLFQQFAASLYSPMLAAGLAFWQTDTANYWGHNAIIRVRPFVDHCGLPELGGRRPLGGEILSHDFVEAALMRRGGWDVYLLPEIEGSYEEMPTNLLDFARRDRRWALGNLQHLRLLAVPGLRPVSRLYFLMGALAYTSSFLWLALLLVGTADAIWRAAVAPEFFGAGGQLFPDWPQSRLPEMITLLTGVGVMLFLPKVLGVILALGARARRHAFGGGPRLVISALSELVFSVLVAPVMMSFHAFFVGCVLLGQDVPWTAQSRHGREVGMAEALRSTGTLTVAGALWGVLTAWLVPLIFWAMTPVLVGLLLAAPLVVLSSSLALGDRLRAAGLLAVPAHSREPRVLRLVAGIAPASAEPGHALPALPPEAPAIMPVQSFAREQNRVRQVLRRRLP